MAKRQDWSGGGGGVVVTGGVAGARGRGWGRTGLSPPLSPAAPELPPRAGYGQSLGWGHGWPQRLLERPCTLAGTLSALLGRLRDVPSTGRRDHAGPHGLT